MILACRRPVHVPGGAMTTSLPSSSSYLTSPDGRVRGRTTRSAAVRRRWPTGGPSGIGFATAVLMAQFYTFGRRVCQSVADSYMRPMRSSFSSSNGGPRSCRPIGRPAFVKPHGMLRPGMPARLHDDRVDVRQVHRQRVVGLLADLERRRRRRRAHHHVALRERLVEVVLDQPADLQRLEVVGVLVAAREHVGAEHDAPLHLLAEALAARLRRRWRSGRPSPSCGGRSACRRSGRGCSTPRPARRGSTPRARTGCAAATRPRASPRASRTPSAPPARPPRPRRRAPRRRTPAARRCVSAFTGSFERLACTPAPAR